MRLVTRKTSDPHGRTVDRYIEDQIVTVLALEPSTNDVRGQLYQLTLRAFSRIAQSSSARMRQRKFTVCYCEWQVRDDFAAVGIALPGRVDAQVFAYFYEEVKAGFSMLDSGESHLNDVGGQPMLRYEDTQVIEYVSGAAASPRADYVAEVRSFEFYLPSRRTRTDSSAVPKVRTKAPVAHSIQTWQDLRLDVLRFFFDMTFPLNYSTLRKAMRDQFGLVSIEAPTHVVGHHGYISVDWISKLDKECEVAIVVAKELPVELKYFVLAHELAHYALHFPLIYAAQEAEQLAWLRPSLDRAFNSIVERVLPDRQILEDAANELASYAVLPEWYDRNFDFILDVDRTPTTAQMMWGALQSFFPDTRENNDFTMFRTRAEMLEREGRELVRAARPDSAHPGSIYETVLAAALRRAQRSAEVRNHKISTSIHDVVQEWRGAANSEVDLVTSGNSNSAQQVHLMPADPRPDRTLTPPLAPRNEEARRWPIVPTNSKLSQWRSVLDPALPARDIAEWRAYRPDFFVVAYPRKKLPRRPVSDFLRPD